MTKRRRKFGQKKRPPEKIFWTILLTVIFLIAAGFLGHNFLLVPTVKVEQAQTPERAVLPETDQEPLQNIIPVWEPKTPETERNILLLGLDDQGMGDAVMIISYNLETFSSSLVSIKRDTFIDNQRWAYKDSGQDHLAWANNRGMGHEEDYHSGARYTAEIIEDLLDIELHDYASISFTGFTELVDAVGGIEIDVDPAFETVYGSLLPAGLQFLSGQQALTYARHRHNPRIEEAGSDSAAGDRVRRNQAVLQAILDRCKELNSDELDTTINLLEDKVYTSLESWDILELGNILYHRDMEELKTAVLPGEGKIVYQKRIDSDMYYYYLDFQATDQLLKELKLK